MRAILPILFTLVMLKASVAQEKGKEGEARASSITPQWGIEVNYGLLSYTESGVISAGVVHTRGKHGLALSTHIWHHDLFTHPDNWSRAGAAFTYSWFPFGSHRMFAPCLFYDLNYGFHGLRREVMAFAEDGSRYGAVRDVENHTIAHHFGVGVRGNIHKRFFAHLGIGAGPASYGDVVNLESRQSAYADVRTSEHPFTHFEPVFMFRVGLVYQMNVSEWKKKGSAFGVH